jgi:ubiquinone/menaquinone biosynthesis C-methylase UbiE
MLYPQSASNEYYCQAKTGILFKMNSTLTQDRIDESHAKDAFSLQAPVFDQLFGSDGIIQYKRERVRAHLLPYLNKQDQILELNAGTGEDAMYFAALGYTVHATDISEMMQQVLQEKIYKNRLQHLVTTECCSFNRMDELQQRGPYDHIFSNFAGLNCTNNLFGILNSCATVLKPGGMIHIVIMPPFCLWETLLLLRGKFSTATRRWLHTRKGVTAKVEGKPFRCWYYSASQVRKAMKGKYQVLKTEGLCTIVPPSYITGFDKKYPVLFRRFCSLETKLKSSWPWNAMGDYYIMSLQKLPPL